MTDDQRRSPDERPTRPLRAARAPLPEPAPAGPPLADPLTFGELLIPDDPKPADPPPSAVPGLGGAASFRLRLPLPGRRAGAASGAGKRLGPPPAADPAVITARRQSAVTRSAPGTPPPSSRDPQGAEPPAAEPPAAEPPATAQLAIRQLATGQLTGSRPRRRPHVPASLLAACAVLIAAAVVAAGVRVATGHPGGGSRRAGAASPPAALQAAAAARGQAARWVRREVRRGAMVACSARMCGALHAAGLPAASLLVLGAGAGDPAGASVVVATPDLRARLGARLVAVYAPLALARFGSGRDEIDVRVVAPRGSAAYLAALRRDREARRSAGAQLLASRRVQVSARARAALAGGRVDARLLLLLPALAAVRPVRVLSFGGAGPGADPQLPLRSARLAAWAAPAGQTEAGYALWLRDYLGRQHAPYRARARIAQVPGGTVVTIEFAAPGPLGLLHGG